MLFVRPGLSCGVGSRRGKIRAWKFRQASLKDPVASWESGHGPIAIPDSGRIS